MNSESMVDVVPPGTLILALVGPTGVGKTQVALRVAHEITVEIVSVDSMQVYRGMDIGTAKPDESARNEVRHHMVDVVDPGKTYSAASYKAMAAQAISSIVGRGKIPLLVGGSGLYYRAIVDDLGFPGGGGASSALRERLEQTPTDELLHMLLELDPKALENIPRTNRRRIVRALEAALEGTTPISSRQVSWQEYRSPFDLAVAGLEMERKVLYALIERRVDEMLEEGLVDEVRRLREMGLRKGTTAGEALGYKQILSYLDSEMSLEAAVLEIKKRSRQYAKRQMTWFRKDPRIRWFRVEARWDSSEEELERSLDMTAKEVIRYFADKVK